MCPRTHFDGDLSLSVSDVDSTTLRVLTTLTLIKERSVPPADRQSGQPIISVWKVLKTFQTDATKI